MSLFSSIRGRLTGGVTIAALAIITVSGWFIYERTKTNTFAQIDRALIEHAQMLSRQVEFENGQVDLEDSEWFESETKGRNFGAFKLWTNDGRDVVQFPKLDESTFPKFAAQGTEDGIPEFRDLQLPGRNSARAVSMRFHPMFDAEDAEEGNYPPPPDLRVNIAVAHDTSTQMATIDQLRWLLVTVGFVSFALLGILIHLLVRKALKPLDAVRNQLISRSNSNLADNIGGEETLPSELQPVVAGFNSLLSQIRRVSAREREFTSSAAHELRTPLAALTSTLEQVTHREHSAEELQEAVDISLITTRDMNLLVERLLALARYDRSEVKMEISKFPLGVLIDGAVESFHEPASERGLRVELDVPDEIQVSADPALLQVVLNNLLENAVSYAKRETPIKISAINGDGKVHLVVENQASIEDSAEIEKVFEPFWRADKARSRPGLHAGLGLSICQKIIDVIGGTISANAGSGDKFRVAVDLPVEAP